jgi:hypothetical protein
VLQTCNPIKDILSERAGGPCDFCNDQKIFHANPDYGHFSCSDVTARGELEAEFLDLSISEPIGGCGDSGKKDLFQLMLKDPEFYKRFAQVILVHESFAQDVLRSPQGRR